MIKYGILLFTVVFFASCVSTEKYQQIVTSKVRESLAIKPTTKNENLYISVQNLPASDSLVNVKRIKYYFIPAIVFWAYENTLKCELSPRSVGEKIAYLIAADPLLSEKLIGQKLEISIEAVPNVFIYSNKGFGMFLLFYAFSSGSETLMTFGDDLKINYWISATGKDTKKGSIKVADQTEKFSNIMKSTKKFTWFFLNEYDNSLENMSHECALILLRELEK